MIAAPPPLAPARPGFLRRVWISLRRSNSREYRQNVGGNWYRVSDLETGRRRWRQSKPDENDTWMAVIETEHYGEGLTKWTIF